MNREQWLTDLGDLIRPIFQGFALKPFKLTCGFPSRNPLGKRKRTIGECHAIETSKAGVHEIFISPLIDEPLEVAGVVVHEITHVAAGIKAGHAGAFVKIRQHIGLTRNKPTQAAPGKELEERLAKMMEQLGGRYPHQAIVPVAKEKKPSSTLKLVCPQCGCKVSMSQRWFEEAGCPVCNCGSPFGLDEKEEKE